MLCHIANSTNSCVARMNQSALDECMHGVADDVIGELRVLALDQGNTGCRIPKQEVASAFAQRLHKSPHHVFAAIERLPAHHDDSAVITVTGVGK